MKDVIFNNFRAVFEKPLCILNRKKEFGINKDIRNLF